MHVAQFKLYNSYIPKDYRKIITEYYAVNNPPSSVFPTPTTNNDISSPNRIGSPKFDLLFNYLINDDISISMTNQFGSISNLAGLGFMDRVNTLAKKGASVVKGGENKNIQNLNNLLNYSIWQKTDPLSLSLSIILYAKTDPLIDVIIPAFVIMSHCMIDFTELGYSYPGLSAFEAISIGEANGVTRSEEVKLNNVDKETSFTSKLISLYIKGLINVNLAMIKNITPVFSKHTAKSKYDPKKYTGDYPISAELTLQIESITPADSSMLWAGALSPVKDRNVISPKTNNTLAESSGIDSSAD